VGSSIGYNTLIINPYTGLVRRKANVPPIRVGYEAGVLCESGFNVKILDMKLHKLDYLRNYIENNNFNLILIHVGLSFTNISGSCYPFTLKILDSLRDLKGDFKVGLMGEHPMLMKEYLTKDSAVNDVADFLVYGEENILPELVTKLSANGSIETLKDIPGLIYKKDSDWKRTPPTKFIQNLDELPKPAFDLMEMDRYRFHILWTSRGCPFPCTFCSTNRIYKKEYRSMSPERIVKDMEDATNNFGKKIFWIVDDLFIYRNERINSICNEILERSLNFKWCVTAGSRPHNLNKPLLEKMKKAGCIQIGFGVESGNAEVLRGLNKGFTLEDVRKNVNLVKEVGIPIQFYFMIGNPGDTLQTIEDTLKFVWEIRPENIIFFPAVPYPGSTFYDWVTKNGRILKDSYGDLFTHEDYEIPEPYYEVKNFTKEEQVIAMRRALALKIARYNFFRFLYVIYLFLRQNRMKYSKDILLMFKNWFRLRLY
jgi:radical SAM superfamily enzyme YgiQ (UPF0313 family)